MVDSSVGTGAALFALDEALILGLGTALSMIGAPSPAIVTVPIVCNAFVLVYADPMPWYQAEALWAGMRDVAAQVPTHLSNAQKALLGDAWSDAGALEFRKYSDRLAQAVTAFNGLLEVTAQECTTVGGAFLAMQIEFILAMIGAILECWAISLIPDPTQAVPTMLKSIVITITLGLIGVIIYAIVNFINSMSGIKQKINTKYQDLAGHFQQQNGKLDGASIKLDAARLAALGDPNGWRLPELPPTLTP